MRSIVNETKYCLYKCTVGEDEGNKKVDEVQIFFLNHTRSADHTKAPKTASKYRLRK